ncbi:transglutaminase domain-containing protein [Rhodococcus sp. OK302]|uniref:transglutaminase domain-containing protein n=1 Tax=Rhodococcus sp. OK302 TaxID=1882769 RepID=UPI000B942672|nr:transglutaminase domain-containing protein [Rhodococcus sp. OK302]
MTCAVMSGLRIGDVTRGDAAGGVHASEILDWGHPSVEQLYAEAARETTSAREFLVAAHRAIQQRIRAVYALDDTQPVSVTLRRERGSCSQRLAVLEALARRHGIRTRVTGLILRGEFWYPRFRRLHAFIPERVLLAWPEFLIDGNWCDVSEVLVEPTEATSFEPFANAGAETLFDALSRAPIRWTEASSCDCLDFSEFVEKELGTFDSRDALFAEFGQTMSAPIRAVIDPVFRNWSASG